MQDIPFNQRVGYACINMTLAKEGIMTNRDAIKRTFITKGLDHISKLCLANVTDLYKIVQWNTENGFQFYRISSGLFPGMTEYEFDDLPDWPAIKETLLKVGAWASEHGQRMEFHPSYMDSGNTLLH